MINLSQILAIFATRNGGLAEIVRRRFARPIREMQALHPPLCLMLLYIKKMKKEVITILKENGKIELFTEERYKTIVEYMKLCKKKSKPLSKYLSIDPANRSKFIADHIILFVSQKLI